MSVFYTFWMSVWGVEWLAFMGTAGIFALIGVVGRMSWFLFSVLMILYFVTFGTGFFGIVWYLPFVIFALYYFFTGLNKLISRGE